jgi:biotin carboxyl carrier protein
MRHERFVNPEGGDAIEIAFDGDDLGVYSVSRTGAPEGRDATTCVIVDVHRAAGVWSGILRDAGGRQHPFRAAPERRRERTIVHLWLDGAVYTIETAPRTARRTGAADAGAARGELAAPMPGTILQVKAAPGDRVAAHAPVIVMESMKMEMTIPAPADGVLREMLCVEGERVELGAVLARLDLDDEDAAS